MIVTTKPFTMKLSINILQEANECLRPALPRHAAMARHERHRGKPIVYKVNNGESQTHFVCLHEGLKVTGARTRLHDSDRRAVSSSLNYRAERT